MVNIGTGHTPTGGGNQEGAGVVLMLGAAAFAAWPIIVLFSISAMLSALFGAYVIFALVLMLRAEDADYERRGYIRFLLVISILTTLLITPFCIVGETGWYTIMGLIVTASYLGALALGLWRALKGLLKFLAGLTAVALTLMLVVLPPPEAAGNQDEKAKWKVKLTAEDVDHQPIVGALAQCTTMMMWENPRRFKFQAKTLKETDDKGEAEFEFSAEMRFKIAVCGVTKPATENEEGYALRTGFAPNPFRGGTFPLTVTLDEKLPAGDANRDLPANYQDHILYAPHAPEPAPEESTGPSTSSDSDTGAYAPPGPLEPSIQPLPSPPPLDLPAPMPSAPYARP